jgi:sugar porter (SP) family MFS transporter
MGAAASGWLSDRISRRWTKFVSGCIYVGGALLCAFAPNETFLIAARFILGLSVGCASFVSPEYIAEHTPPKLRGGNTTYNQLMVTLGILIAYIAGFLLKDLSNNWRWMFGLGAVPGAVLAISMLFVPHSPRWLVQKGRIEEARTVLARTRNKSDDDIDEELAAIEEVVEQQERSSVRDLFSARVRPLLTVGVMLATLQQFVGINTIIYFTSTILKDTGASTDLSLQQAVYVGVTNFVMTCVAVLCMDWVGRRWLLIPGTIGLTVALFGLGAFFQWDAINTHNWVGLACVIAYIAFFAVGQGPVFWVVISEVYPLHLRSKAMAVATMANWAANFIVSYYFLQLVDAIGRPGTFWLYGGVGVLATIYYFFKLPETKQKSLEQIEREITGRQQAKAATAPA